MTVADIKEYINIKIKYYSEIDQNLFTPIINVKREFEEVKKLLDELEPNNIQQAIKIIDKERDKLKFDVDKHQVDSCIFEIRNILGLGAKENNK